MHVAIAIPTIPSRAALLARAIASVEQQQTEHVVSVHVAHDNDRTGAWGTRNDALAVALAHNPDWVGFLDDDDELLPHHIERLTAEPEGDIVSAWYTIPERPTYDPFPDTHRRRVLSLGRPHIVPIAYMARASFLSAALADGCGFQAERGSGWMDQDWPILRHMLEAGAVHVPLDEVTWLWHHHGRNTSGLGV